MTQSLIMNRAIWALGAALLAGCSPAPFDYETAVKREMRDPDSAKFSDVTVNVESACGFVNSKNGFGGYAGRQPFVVVGSNAETADVTLIEATAEALPLINARCQEPTKSKINDWIADAAIEALKQP